MSLLGFSVTVLWIVVIVQTGVIFALARQIGILFERIAPVGAMISNSGPALGDKTPNLALPNSAARRSPSGPGTGRS